MVSTQMLYVIIIVLTLAVIGLAIPLGIYMQKSTEEGLCLCRSGGLVMQDVERNQRMQEYNHGLTEYSELEKPNWLTAAVNPPYL